jgi:hypothetical protein
MPKVINIRRVPDAVHSKLKAHAGQQGESLSAYLLRELTLRLDHCEADEPWMNHPRKTKMPPGKNPSGIRN